MSELKVDTIVNVAGSGKPNLPVSPTLGGAAISAANTYSYTSSGTEPSSPKNGAIWWDSSNNEVYLYIAGEFKKVTLNASAASGNAWSGDRGLCPGRYDSGNTSLSNEIQRFDITTPGNSVDFGDMTGPYYQVAACGSSARTLIAGGYNFNTNARSNVIDYYAAATPGNGTDFGDLTLARSKLGGDSNGVRAIFCGGLYGGGYFTPTVDYVTVANTGNATDFGDISLNEPARISVGSSGDSTRALHVHGYTNSDNRVDYFTYASPGNGTDFGDLTRSGGNVGACSDATRSVFSGAANNNSGNVLGAGPDTIDYVTTQTTGNATDFGNLATSAILCAATANATRGVTLGAAASGTKNNMDYYEIQTPANATDFGDLVNELAVPSAASGAAS